MLLLSHLLLCIGADELFNDHEATTNTDYEPAIEHLGKDLPRAEHVEPVSKALNRYWAPCLIDVVSEQLVQHVTLLSCEELCRLLLLTFSHDFLVEVVDLLIAAVKLGLDLGQVVLSRLHQLVKLVDILDENVLFVLQEADLLLVPVAVL